MRKCKKTFTKLVPRSNVLWTYPAPTCTKIQQIVENRAKIYLGL